MHAIANHLFTSLYLYHQCKKRKLKKLRIEVHPILKENIATNCMK